MKIGFDTLARGKEEMYFRAREAELIARIQAEGLEAVTAPKVGPALRTAELAKGAGAAAETEPGMAKAA